MAGRSTQRRALRAPGACTAFVLGWLLVSPAARADYPIASHRYLADPGSLVSGGRVYLYGSNDDDNPLEGGYEMASIVCVSSVDMKNWTDHGEVLRVPRDASWAGDSWAPYAHERDGTIYLYFGNSASGVGVATSDSPLGPFKDPRGSYLINSSTPGAPGTDSWLFDPGGMIDEDGKAYLAFGGNGVSNARIIALGSDLVSVMGSAVGFSPPGFYEAAFMFKRNGVYYFSYSTNPDNGLRIDYMTSDSPMSGYEYAGVVADQPPVNENNNHASQFEYGGKWYHAYHNRYVATQAGIPTTYKRNFALEVMEFAADGSIEKVEYTTDGVPQIGTLDPYTRVEAETTNAQRGIETEPCEDGGMNVTDIEDGDWVRVRGVDFGASGAVSFSASVASEKGGGRVEVRLGGETGMLAATCTVPNTGGAQTFMTTTCDVTSATGVKDVYFVFKGEGTELFNFDHWQFTSVEGGGSGGAGGGGSGGAPGGGAGAASGGASGGVPAASGGMPGGGPSTSGGTPSSPSGGMSTSPTGGAGPSPVGTGGSPPASGGVAGTSSAAGGAGGNPAAEPPPAPAPAQDDSESGCSCGVVGRSSRAGWAVLSLGLAMLIVRRKQR